MRENVMGRLTTAVIQINHVYTSSRTSPTPNRMRRYDRRDGFWYNQFRDGCL